MTDWRWVRHRLAIRADNRCEGCGARFVPGGAEPSVHHRRPGKMGGRKHDPDHDSLANLLLLCGGRLGGVLGCHGRTESYREEARKRGFLVNENDNPADVPVILWSGRHVLLDPLSGGYALPPGGWFPTRRSA